MCAEALAHDRLRLYSPAFGVFCTQSYYSPDLHNSANDRFLWFLDEGGTRNRTEVRGFAGLCKPQVSLAKIQFMATNFSE